MTRHSLFHVNQISTQQRRVLAVQSAPVDAWHREIDRVVLERTTEGLLTALGGALSAVLLPKVFILEIEADITSGRYVLDAAQQKFDKSFANPSTLRRNPIRNRCELPRVRFQASVQLIGNLQRIFMPLPAAPGPCRAIYVIRCTSWTGYVHQVPVRCSLRLPTDLGFAILQQMPLPCQAV